MKPFDWPQFDAAGYLVGWIDSWYMREEPSEKKRISNGLHAAAAASGLGGLVKKWFS